MYYSNGVLQSNEEFGVIAVYFGNTLPTGSFSGQETKIASEKSGNGINWEIINQDYSAPMEFTLQICNPDGKPISQEQERALNRFLCHQGEYGWFFIDSMEYADIWFKCIIHSPKIWRYEGRSGLEYTVTTNSPVAYTDERIHNISITGPSQTYTLYINSDEEYPIYPVLEITLLESGDLTITNTLETNEIFQSTLKNTTSGEKIIIDNEYPFLESTLLSHQIINDFNFKWIALYNGINNLSFNKRCNVTIKYREYRKMIIC